MLDEPGSGVIDIDLVVLSHADSDHVGGLVHLIEDPKIRVRKVVHSGIATFDEIDPVTNKKKGSLGTVQQVDGAKYLVTRHDTLQDLQGQGSLSGDFQAWAAALDAEGVDYQAVYAGGPEVKIDDPNVTVEVVGPVLDSPTGFPKAYEWFGDLAHTINGHSVVLRLTYEDVKILLTGDINTQGGKKLCDRPASAAMLDAHVLKAPHHGSEEFYPPLFEAVNPQMVAISSGEMPDFGHPRPNFLGACGKYSRSDVPLVYSTELAAVYVASDQLEDQAALDRRTGSVDDDRAFSRELFRKSLSGIINIRTDGHVIHGATRVQTGYWWVTDYPLTPADRSAPSP